jgi:heme exporter protein C
MQTFANPTKFAQFAARLLPWCTALTIVLLVSGLYYALFNSPDDYQQGATVRIMYIHVPAAWMGLFAYIGLAVASAVGLVWKHPLAHLAAKTTAPIGAAFTLLCLITGSLWGKPMWGAYWVWDARLTSMLLLFFLYLGFMALQNAFDNPARGQKTAAVFALIGAVNVPVVKFSVDWWNTLHQPSILNVKDMPGFTVDGDMLLPLLLMAGAFKALYITLVLLGVRSEITAAKVRTLRMNRVLQSEEG